MKIINIEKYRSTNNRGFNYLKILHRSYQNGRLSNGKYFSLCYNKQDTSTQENDKELGAIEIIKFLSTFKDNFNLVVPLARTNKLFNVFNNCKVVDYSEEAGDIYVVILCDFIKHDVDSNELLKKIRKLKLEEIES